MQHGYLRKVKIRTPSDHFLKSTKIAIFTPSANQLPNVLESRERCFLRELELTKRLAVELALETAGNMSVLRPQNRDFARQRGRYANLIKI